MDSRNKRRSPARALVLLSILYSCARAEYANVGGSSHGKGDGGDGAHGGDTTAGSGGSAAGPTGGASHAGSAGAGSGGTAYGEAGSGGTGTTGDSGAGGEASGGALGSGGASTGGASTGGGANQGGAPGAGELAVEYMDCDNDTATMMRPCMRIVNNSGRSVPLAQLKLRYWFTADVYEVQDPVTGCEWSTQIPCTSMSLTVSDWILPALDGADRYLEIGFTEAAGEVAAGSKSKEIRLSLRMYNWRVFDETDDYSRGTGPVAYAVTDRITLYHGEELLSGNEPGPGPAPTGIQVQTKTDTAEASATSVEPQVKLINPDHAFIPLQELTIRYYFTHDAAASPTLQCNKGNMAFNLDSAYGYTGEVWVGDGPVTATCGTAAGTNADRYLEIGFTADAGYIRTRDQVTVGGSANLSTWATMQQSNDYSFNPSSTFVAWDKVVVYRNGTAVAGAEP